MENSASETGDSASLFTQKDTKKSPSQSPGKKCPESTSEVITIKDFLDFMKTAYQACEHLDDGDSNETKIDWEELSKRTILNHVIDNEEKKLLQLTLTADVSSLASKSCSTLEKTNNSQTIVLQKRKSHSDIDELRKMTTTARVEMLGVWTEANLNCKLNDVLNEGILDSILPYLAGYKKANKTVSDHLTPFKKNSIGKELNKHGSFGGYMFEKGSRDRLGRRKSSLNALQDKLEQKQDGDVEIHVCDEVKGQKKDFRCPQKLLVSKMGYFADVTAGQRLEDMDISVHCDIQIFDWLMRWVKKDTILVADWPLLNPSNVVPILVSASFLQMDPLLHDCLMYCHAHMSDILKTFTNLACLNDSLITRLAALYTNVELESIRDRRDKIQSRLYCKMIMSLAEPVPETLRGHYATLATVFKCLKCNKLLGRHVAEQVPCQPASMRIDRFGNVLSTHTRDPSWSLNEYITWLYGEVRSWRRVYWRLWSDCHFLKCQLCDNYFPIYQMEWCSHHTDVPHMFAVEGSPPFPTGRYPCCGERAYRYEVLSRNTGCHFREHMPDLSLPADEAVMEIYQKFREIISMRPPQLVFPERVTRLIPREPDEKPGRLQCKEVFWWDGIQLVPPRQPFGLLGKLYTSNNKFNPLARPGSTQSLGAGSSTKEPEVKAVVAKPAEKRMPKKGAANTQPDMSDGAEAVSSDGESNGESDASDSGESEEDTRRKRPVKRTPAKPPPPARKRTRVVGRQWLGSLSARSNQDGQRRYEERTNRVIRAAIVRRVSITPQTTVKSSPLHPGGAYARLESEWREQFVRRTALSARNKQQNKCK